MSKNLQLNIYLMRSSRACMVFKRNGILYRINNLADPLALVANLAQLSKAIDSGAEQRCFLALFDRKGKHWVLGCTFLNGIVALTVWLNSQNAIGELYVQFNWGGMAADFGMAVNELCEMVARAKIFGAHRNG
jgi:hypothetical protein